MRKNHARRAAVAAGAILTVATTGAAQAHTVYPTRGTTSVGLGGDAGKALKAAGVKASGASLRVSGGAYSFHSLDEGGGGTLRHDGTLVLRRGSRLVRLADPVVTIKPAKAHAAGVVRHGGGHGKPHASGTLAATVAGKRLTLASLDLHDYRASEAPVGFSGADLELTRSGAAALSRAFSLSLRAGQSAGSVRTTGIAQPLSFTGGRTTLTLTSKAVAAFRAAGASVAATPGTKGAGTVADPFSFPITGGRFEMAAFTGSVLHSGGLVLTAEGRSFGGQPTLALRDLSVSYDEELVVRSGGPKGLPVLRLLFAKTTKFTSGPDFEAAPLDVFLTRQAAALVAPVLGMSPAAAAKLKLGLVDVDADYRNLR